jgi:rubrerythrin
MKRFDQLTEQQVLALAISLEEEHERVYADLAERFRTSDPDTSKVFEVARDEEADHRRRLLDLYQERFGNHIPLIRRQDVQGFVPRKSIWLSETLGIVAVQNHAAAIELETQRFYERAAARSQDPAVRKLLGDLAAEEREHAATAIQAAADAKENHDGGSSHSRLFVMQVVQPGLVGLMDGSVSTLAPVFAAAAATRNTHEAFLVGLAASLGAGISMGFAEALSDDGVLTGRGHPWIRGLVCGAMTTAGGIGHTLPFLIPTYRTAMAVALGVVVFELAAITWLRHRYMESPWVAAGIQIAFGGALVFACGLWIGSS